MPDRFPHIMMLARWKRFTWELRNLPPYEDKLGSQFKIRPYVKEEEMLIRNTLASAFRLDSDWSDGLNLIQDRLDAEWEEVFAQEEPAACLVLTHGSRIIGASTLNFNQEGLTQLTSGPTILIEYRNRGLGTALLQSSLEALKQEGLKQAHGISKANIPAAKFLYPKFNSISEHYEFDLIPAKQSQPE